jgi:hypothetical protein
VGSGIAQCWDRWRDVGTGGVMLGWAKLLALGQSSKEAQGTVEKQLGQGSLEKQQAVEDCLGSFESSWVIQRCTGPPVGVLWGSPGGWLGGPK